MIRLLHVKRKTITINIPIELDKHLESAAKERLQSKSDVVRGLLLDHVRKEEIRRLESP